MIEKYLQAVNRIDTVKYTGKVQRVKGVLVESSGPQAVVGELCRISVPGKMQQPDKIVDAEVVAVHGDTISLMPYQDMTGIEVGCLVTASGHIMNVGVCDSMLGRVLDALGRPIDGLGPLGVVDEYPVYNEPPNPMFRPAITKQIMTGVRSIDGMIPVGMGQRMGIFAGSGVGKSTLMGMIARNTSADINVIALIGERGRELKEFIENDLGPEGLKRSVIIVSTSETPALARVRGAFTATAVAEYFRDKGKNVMLLFDSVTRFALSQREIGLAIGEPPATRGYTPSVFNLLPKLLERSGTSPKGTITGLYTVLVEGDDMDEPIADAVRGILDGHIVLSRKLAQRYHYPAVDILESVSRLTNKITTPAVRDNMGAIRRMLAIYTEKEDLINVGAYAKGSNPELDEAIDKMPEINDYLRQKIEDKVPLRETFEQAGEITGQILTPQDMNNEGLSLFA